jgi:Zn-dependent protease
MPINTTPRPLKFAKLTQVMRIKGVPVYVHWSVLLIVAIILLNALRRPLLALFGLASYLGVLLIHEYGHVVAARRKLCEVISIEIYPVFGVTEFQTPWSRFDHCVIAWGGVIAQLIVALPLVAFVAVFGYTRFEPLNAALAILGFFSLGVAIFNLLPLHRLDGSIAWGFFPAFLQRLRTRRQQRQTWRHR